MFLFAAGITVTNHPMNKTSASLSLDYLYVQGAGLREGGHHVAGEGASHSGLHGKGLGGCDMGGPCAMPCPVYSDCPTPGWGAEGDDVSALLFLAVCKAQTW